MGRENVRRHRAKCLTQKTRIAANNDARGLRFLRNHVTGDSMHRAAHIGEGKLLRNDGAPSRGTELDLRHHVVS